MPVVVHQPFVETTAMQRIDNNAGRKSYEIVTIETVGSENMIEMLMKGNFQSAASCSVPVHRSTFYFKCVELKNVTNLAKKAKWCQFLSNNQQELGAQKNLLKKRIFYCKIVNFLIDNHKPSKKNLMQLFP